MSATERTEHVELAVSGMTCASCAARIERKLNKLTGVAASVNYATELASVDYDPELVEPTELLGAITAVGYQAAFPVTATDHGRDANALRLRHFQPHSTPLGLDQ